MVFIFTADVCKKFIDRLDTVYKRRLTILEYIPGSFYAEQAKEILSIHDRFKH
jgi:hypothetical protein